MSINNYIKIARPNHWFKNIFMLPGVAVALLVVKEIDGQILLNLVIGLVSASLVASANYVINEWLDKEFDKHHPLKKDRPSALGNIKKEYVYLEWGILAVIGLALAWTISVFFFYSALWLLVMGVLYNVKPFRTKDKIYLDVLSESINNPIRFLLGWFIVTSAVLPPSSVLIAYWMGGAFLMAVKRFAEYRFIGDKNIAGLYRRSFRYYTENSLLVSILIYAMSFAFFFGVFMIKYRIELLVCLPLFSLLFGWYLWLGMKTDSPAQRPEKLYREKKFMAFIAIIVLSISVLLFFDFPVLHYFLDKDFNINYVTSGTNK
jgi:decaprenyl-phosphate phosphoribosyltransferase